MPFFADKKIRDEFSIAADFLADEIQKHHKFWKIRTRKKWPEQLRKISQQIGKAKFQSVFSFMLKNYGLTGMPRIMSPASFKKFLPMLEDQMTHNALLFAPLTISQEIQRIIEDADLQWPGDEGERIADCLQRSLDAYVAFHAKLLVAIETKPPSDARDAAEWFYRALPEPDEYIAAWLLTLNQIAWNWSRWSGNIMTLVWRPNGKLFGKYAANLLLDYDGDAETFKSILAFLGIRSDI